MISVAIIWIYMFVTILPIGFAILKFLFGLLNYRNDDGSFKFISVPKALLAGIAGVTVYAEIYSLFDGVGGKACLLLLALDAMAIFYSKKEMVKALSSMRKVLNNLSFLQAFVIFILALIVVYCTSSGYFIYDTGLYHAQAIHWLEDYGVVIGSANVAYRIGYNSSCMCLFSLYSFRWLIGQSFHACNGFVYIAGLIEAIRHLYRGNFKKYIMSTSVSIGSLFCYILLIYYVGSPTSDIMPMAMVMWLVLYWCDFIENGEKEVCPYALLCVLAVVIFTGKVSTATIVLLTIKPAVMLIKDKKIKDIFIYIGLGILVMLPFLIRNVLITGWLLYPFAGIDLFNFDWKLSKDALVADAWNSCVYGRHANYKAFEITKWFPSWWQYSERGEKFWLIANIVGLLLWAGRVFALIKSKFKLDYKWIHLECAFIAGFLYWFFASPQIRYGIAFVVLCPFVISAVVLSFVVSMDGTKIKYKYPAYLSGAVIMCLALCGVFPENGAFGYLESYRSEHINLVRQEDYASVETEELDVGGLTVYYPKEGLQVWYYAFPGAESYDFASNIEMRGDSIKDGFRAIEPFSFN